MDCPMLVRDSNFFFHLITFLLITFTENKFILYLICVSLGLQTFKIYNPIVIKEGQTIIRNWNLRKTQGVGVQGGEGGRESGASPQSPSELHRRNKGTCSTRSGTALVQAEWTSEADRCAWERKILTQENGTGGHCRTSQGQSMQVLSACGLYSKCKEKPPAGF